MAARDGLGDGRPDAAVVHCDGDAVGAARHAAVREAVYRTLLESTSEMVFVCEHDEMGVPKTFIEVNGAACEALGYTREELLGISPLDLNSAQAGRGSAAQQRGASRGGRAVP